MAADEISGTGQAQRTLARMPACTSPPLSVSHVTAGLRALLQVQALKLYGQFEGLAGTWMYCTQPSLV